MTIVDDHLSFVDVLNAEGADKGCYLSRELERMTLMMRSDVQVALADKSKSAAAISRAMTKLGFPISEGNIRKCRRTCLCWRTNVSE